MTDIERPSTPMDHDGAKSPAPASPEGSPGLAIAAVILSVLVAPVGLILGLVAVAQSRRAGKPAGGLAVAATVVGATLTGVTLVGGIILAAVTLTTVSNVVADSEHGEFCAIVASYGPELHALVDQPSDRGMIDAIDSLLMSGAPSALAEAAPDDWTQQHADAFTNKLTAQQDQLVKLGSGSVAYVADASDSAGVFLEECTAG